MIVYQKSESDFFLIPNAANCADVALVLSERAPSGITVTNLHQGFGVFAIQGPDSQKLLTNLGLSPVLDYMQFSEVEIPGRPELGTIIICRTGYTGEYGFELIPLWDKSEALWNVLVDAIAPLDGRVCGLGSRDTLRTEMGYPLHGHELSTEISALEAGASWAVVLAKENFAGRAALLALKEAGITRQLRAIKSRDRGIPRAGMDVLLDGKVVGVITSGTFSPSLKTGIGLALIEPGVKVGDHLEIDVRGRMSEVEVVKAPFVPSHVR